MRHKTLAMALCVMLLGAMYSTASAEDVYVTKYGKKYHKENARFIKGKDVTKLSREEAEAKGYEPSSDFLKEELPAEDVAAAQQE